MEAANQILETIIRAKNHNKSPSVSSGLSGKTLRPAGAPQDTAHAYPKPLDTSSYGAQRPPSADALSAATTSYAPPQSPTSQRQPLPPRTSSSSPAATAAAVATGVRPQQMPGKFKHYLSPPGYAKLSGN
jgi:hypothetical protein